MCCHSSFDVRKYVIMGSFFPFIVTGPRHSKWNVGSGSSFKTLLKKNENEKFQFSCFSVTWTATSRDIKKVELSKVFEICFIPRRKGWKVNAMWNRSIHQNISLRISVRVFDCYELMKINHSFRGFESKSLYLRFYYLRCHKTSNNFILIKSTKSC